MSSQGSTSTKDNDSHGGITDDNESQLEYPDLGPFQDISVSDGRVLTGTNSPGKQLHIIAEKDDEFAEEDESKPSASNRLPSQAARPIFSRHTIDDGVQPFDSGSISLSDSDYDDADSSNVLITEVKSGRGARTLELPSSEWEGVAILTERERIRKERQLLDETGDDENDDGFDTDLEDDDEVEEHDPSGRTTYIKACEQLGIVPASYFTRHITEPEISMKFHGLGPAGAKAIARVLRNNITLERLNLSGNMIEAEGGAVMARMLVENDYITSLCLTQNRLGHMGAYHLCKMLDVNTGLRSLDLSDNEFGDREAEYFAEALESNKFLKEFRLCKNKFGNVGGQLLGPALGANDVLDHLDLSWNQIRGDGAVAIGRGLKENVRLKVCNLSWNGLGADGGKALADALMTNDSLLELDISGNRIDIDIACLIAKSLKVNETLRTLKMGNNPISTTGAVALISAIKNNDSSVIVYLDLTDIPVEFEYVRVVKEIQHKRQFRELHGPEMRSGNTAADVGKLGVDPGKINTDVLMVLSQHIVVNDTRIIDLLKSHDVDGTMYVTREQFACSLQELGVTFDNKQMDDLVRKLDKRNDGTLYYGDLVEQAEATTNSQTTDAT